jgi:hypothetical protein
MVYIYNIVFSHKNYKIMSFAGKWMELKNIMYNKVTEVQKDKDHVFSHMWKLDLKDRHIHKYIHDSTYTYIEYVCNIGTFQGD